MHLLMLGGFGRERLPSTLSVLCELRLELMLLINVLRVGLE